MRIAIVILTVLLSVVIGVATPPTVEAIQTRRLDMTAGIIATVVGALISVLLEVVPRLKEKWSEWEWKPLTLFGLFEAVPLVAWALTCFAGMAIYDTPDCSWIGAVTAAGVGFTAFMASQTTYAVGTRKTMNAKARG